MERLPSNCVLDKGRTGCGATTLAIMQQGSTIIAVPYVNLIKSKESQHSDILLGVCEGTGRKEILEYAQSHSTHKIMTTYDSLPKVMEILESNGYDVRNDYQLVIDERNQDSQDGGGLSRKTCQGSSNQKDKFQGCVQGIL